MEEYGTGGSKAAEATGTIAFVGGQSSLPGPSVHL